MKDGWLHILKTGALLLALAMFVPPVLSETSERYDWYPGVFVMAFLMIAYKAAQLGLYKKLSFFDAVEVAGFCLAYVAERMVINDLWMASLKAV